MSSVPRPRSRMPLLLLAVIAILLATLGAPPKSATAASGPSSWRCDSHVLGLDKVVVERAPVVNTEKFSDGHHVKNEPDARGKWIPVILVHGWTSKATHPGGTFSSPINLSPNAFSHPDGGHSFVGQIQDVPGAAVFTYDYHPYSGRWVTDSHLGPGLGKVIDCLAKASGEKVIVVGHSMGGLIARYAAAAPAPGGARDRSGEISQIVTLGTPNKGSVLAMIAGGVLDLSPRDGLTPDVVSVIRLILAACGAVTTADMDGTPCSIVPQVGAFQGEAGRALRFGSKELASLATVPESIAVDALAGETSFAVPKLGWFAHSWDTTDVSVGDMVVTRGSAQSGTKQTGEIDCHYQMNPVRGATDAVGLTFGLTDENDAADFPVRSLFGPCVHTSLMRAQELANEVAGAIAADIGDRYVSRTDLLTASVPALRGNPAGNLVDGVLPNTGNGYVGLERTGGAAPALGDLTGDGRGDAAAVISYTSGAAGGDQNVYVYTKRDGNVIRLAEYEPARSRPDFYHASVTGMIIKNGTIELSFSTSLPGALEGPDMAVTLRLQGDQLVASNLREVDGATADALPAYPATAESGRQLSEYLRQHNLPVVELPIEYQCESLAVLGADLAAGDLDLVLGWSLCDGDPVQEMYRIRDHRIVKKGTSVVDSGMGVPEWKAFIAPYGKRKWAGFWPEPGDSWYYLTPIN